MKKKIVAMCATVAIAALAVGGTLAYFTDTDSAKNVMTSGNVSIVQTEKQRVVENGEFTNVLEDFEDNKPLLPAVFYDENGKVIAPDKTINIDDVPTWSTMEIADVNGDQDALSAKLLDKGLTNEVDKIVNVTNDGDPDQGAQSVFVRTVFLIEDKIVDPTSTYENGKFLSDYVSFMWTENGNQNSGEYNRVLSNGEPELVAIGDTSYSVRIHYYEVALEPGKTTAASLKQMYLDPNTGNYFYENLGGDGEYTVLALSQAVQTAGFTDDRDALNAAFGEVTVANCVTWFTPIANPQP